ncbi:hypothetical protein AAFF_G00392020 [Aldrovandia affinis]|uniref:Uncharacterized protein n=1 Tax=Aldrovandia affinis TaxID=143900 RepID=A0AAD7SEF9_9TELE|nr:hypothetical protein AAFF_G00392020 [Aldrovandia affinis]
MNSTYCPLQLAVHSPGPQIGVCGAAQWTVQQNTLLTVCPEAQNTVSPTSQPQPQTAVLCVAAWKINSKKRRVAKGKESVRESRRSSLQRIASRPPCQTEPSRRMSRSADFYLLRERRESVVHGAPSPAHMEPGN